MKQLIQMLGLLDELHRQGDVEFDTEVRELWPAISKVLHAAAADAAEVLGLYGRNVL